MRKNKFSARNDTTSLPNTMAPKKNFGPEDQENLSEQRNKTLLNSVDISKEENKKKVIDAMQGGPNPSKGLSGGEYHSEITSNAPSVDGSETSPIKRKNEITSECVKNASKSPKKVNVLENGKEIRETKYSHPEMDEYLKDNKNCVGFFHPKKENISIDGRTYEERYLTIKVLIDSENKEYHIQKIPFKYKEIDHSYQDNYLKELCKDSESLSQMKVIEFSPKLDIESSLFTFDDPQALNYDSNNNNNDDKCKNLIETCIPVQPTSSYDQNNISEIAAISLVNQTGRNYSSIFSTEVFQNSDELEFPKTNQVTKEHKITNLNDLKTSMNLHDTLVKNNFRPVTNSVDFLNQLSFNRGDATELAFVSPDSKYYFYGSNPYIHEEMTSDSIKTDQPDLYLELMLAKESTKFFFFIDPYSIGNFSCFFADEKSKYLFEQTKPKKPNKEQISSNRYLTENRGICGVLFEENKFYSLSFNEFGQETRFSIQIYVRGGLM